MSMPIKTVNLQKSGVTVSLGRQHNQLVLIIQPQLEVKVTSQHEAPIKQLPAAPGELWAIMSSIPSEDPFPGYSVEGNEMFWIKNYSENEGLLEELTASGWLRITGRTLKQGFVTFPMAELRLDEHELAHACASCERFELTDEKERFKRCGKCRKAYYCSVEHQHDHWKRHKLDCKDLLAGRLAHVENRRRQEMSGIMLNHGAKYVDQGGQT